MNIRSSKAEDGRLRVLNLYARVGGNRKLWTDVEVVAVENVPEIADIYKDFFPNDTIIVADAHQYLLDHFKEFDFIWSSPPCPTHSRVSTGLSGWGIYRYPDVALYQEIIFLKHFFKGNWVVENVIPYYKALIPPTAKLDRHYFWSNKPLGKFVEPRNYTGTVTNATVNQLQEQYDFKLPAYAKDKRKILRNIVNPKLGSHVFNAATKEIKQEILL